MSKLEISADIESTEALFAYTGADLQKPLEELRAYLLAQAKKLSSELGPESSRDVPTLAGLISKNPATELQQKIKLALSEAFEAQLWAAEAKRTPECVWKLRMSQLKWLYRQHMPGVS